MPAAKTDASIRRSIDRIGRKGPGEQTQRDLNRLMEWGEHPNAEIRVAALQALEAFGDDWDLVEPVSDLLAAEQDPRARAAVIETLAFFGIGYQEEAEASAEYEEREPDYEGGTPEGYRAVRHILGERAGDEKEAEPARVAAIVGMGELADDLVMREAILPHLDAPAPAIRAAALKAIGFSGNASGVGEKILAAIDAPEGEVRAQAMIAAGNLRLEDAADRIRPLLDSPDPVLRAAAWYGFAGCADLEEADDVLGRLGETITEADPLYDDYQDALDALNERFEEEDTVPGAVVAAAMGESNEREIEREMDRRVRDFTRALAKLGVPEDGISEAEFVAENFLHYLLDVMGTRPADVRRAAVSDYLLGFFPRKVTMPPDQEMDAPAALARYLRYLGRSGELAEGEALASYAESLAKDYWRKLHDRTNWGVAKTLMMQALSEGIDPTDEDAMQQFVSRLNARLG